MNYNYLTIPKADKGQTDLRLSVKDEETLYLRICWKQLTSVSRLNSASTDLVVLPRGQKEGTSCGDGGRARSNFIKYVIIPESSFLEVNLKRY